MLTAIPAFCSKAAPPIIIAQIHTDMHKVYEFYSQDMTFEQKRYRLFIAAPKKPANNLSALYLTDGNTQFPLAVNSVKTDRTLPLIIGIGYPMENTDIYAARTRDYTFRAEGEIYQQGGGAADFLRFLTLKVKPFVENEYNINPRQQYYFGHSFGALFGLYILFNQPELFQYYTLASPSLWWGNGKIIPTRIPWLSSRPKNILITLGEYEENPAIDPKMSVERLAKIRRRQQIYPTRRFAEQLAVQGQNAVFRLIPEADHGTAVLPAIEETVKEIQNNGEK